MANYPSRHTIMDGTWDNFGDTINLQNWLKTTGYYSKARESDAVWGYWTTLALQQYMRSKVVMRESVYAGKLDGDFGPLTKRAMANTAWYVFGGRPGSGLGSYCAGGDCVVNWPNKQVVHDWQYMLNGTF